MIKRTLESVAASHTELMYIEALKQTHEAEKQTALLGKILESKEKQEVHEMKQAKSERAKGRAQWMQVGVGIIALSLAVTTVLTDLAIINKDHAVFKFFTEIATMIGGV